MGISWNRGTPTFYIINFNGIFPYKPSILGTHILGNLLTWTSSAWQKTQWNWWVIDDPRATALLLSASSLTMQRIQRGTGCSDIGTACFVQHRNWTAANSNICCIYTIYIIYIYIYILCIIGQPDQVQMLFCFFVTKETVSSIDGRNTRNCTAPPAEYMEMRTTADSWIVGCLRNIESWFSCDWWCKVSTFFFWLFCPVIRITSTSWMHKRLKPTN